MIAGVCLVAGTSLALGDIRLEYEPNKLGIRGPKQIYQENQTYSCTMQDAVSVRADGTLGHKVRPVNIWSNELPLKFNIHSGTGVFSVGGRDEQWEILQLGSDIRTLIAHNPNRSPLNTLLRIVTYTAPMLFWLTDSTDVITGTCEIK